MIESLARCFLVPLLLGGTASAAQVISITRAPEVAEVDGMQLNRASKVLKRFFANERHPECYRVLFSIFEGNLRVDFVPKRPEFVRHEGDLSNITKEVPCGKNIG